MQTISSPSTFMGLVLLQVLQILFILAVPVWAASWVYKNKPHLLPLGWAGTLGALFVVWPRGAERDADWEIPLFISGFVVVASLIQFLRNRQTGGKFWRFMGMNGWTISGIGVLYVCFLGLHLDFTLVITRQIFDAKSPISGDLIGMQTTHYLGPFPISASQAAFSSSLYEWTFPIILLGLSVFQPSLDLIRHRLIGRKRRA